jgi:hypothetical protein
MKSMEGEYQSRSVVRVLQWWWANEGAFVFWGIVKDSVDGLVESVRAVSVRSAIVRVGGCLDSGEAIRELGQLQARRKGEADSMRAFNLESNGVGLLTELRSNVIQQEEQGVRFGQNAS